MNFIEEVMERTPASTLGIVAIDSRGNRREWHHGELIARSAGLSGAMAARGVGRGDAVMKGLNTAVWPLTGYTFIGDNPLGAHIRVRWFDGARIPPPHSTAAPRRAGD
jgi:hypothetical protein